MILKELLELLTKIVKAHPEAEESEAWVIDRAAKTKFRIGFIGFDKRHRPPRIKLEE